MSDKFRLLDLTHLSPLMRRLPALCLIFLLAACSLVSEPEATPTASQTLPPPEVFTTQAPDTEAAARAYLESWKAEDYEAMYAMLSSASQTAITQEEFSKRYNEVANEMALSGVSYEMLLSQVSTGAAEVPYRYTLSSALIGDIQRDGRMKLEMEQGQWRVKWDESLILPELAGGNYLRMDRDTPNRATIYDRNGNPLAEQAEAVAIGVWPDYVDLAESKGLLSLLAGLTPYRSDTIAHMIEDADPGAYLALGEVPADEDPRRINQLSTWGAVVTSAYNSRLYLEGGIAPHVVGYVSALTEDEIAEFRRKGYRSDERVGRKGLELWGESTLRGVHGGSLYVFNPEGQPVAELGALASQPGQDIYTTLDGEFQRQAQKAMSVFNGAIVVMERDTGRVLAMVSTPGFNPNAYQIENYNWMTLLNGIVNDPNSPQFNRATQGQYPLGSVFKIITTAAGLESGRFTEESTYDCGYVFEELAGFPRYDWTWDHFQEDGTTQPSGLLTLPQGLIRSCNPYFWHIGLDLFNAGLTKAISDMSRGFGLGSRTGIEGVDEEAGNIPEPGSQVDAINLAIGQGDMQVTPLQVARFIAAMGNGGTLYRPQLIEKIVGPDGEASYTFKPEVQGTLPVKPETMKMIQEAMRGVVISEKPTGTAYRAFKDLDIVVAGKTGTATSATGEPHAWFAGYTMENNPEKPDIAVAVIAENAGEGSEIAAPIFRRVVELYFYGKPLRTYRWESTFDVTRSPTPIITITPTLQPGLNP